MNQSIVLILIPVFPMLLALGLMTGLLQQISLRLAPLAALPALVMSLVLMPEITLELPWLLLGTYVGFDNTARIFLFFSALLWLVAGIYTVGYLTERSSRKRFFIWFLLAMSGNFGLILSQDLALFYTFFALMSFTSYGLVVHERTQQALRAGRVYIILVVVGEVLLFSAFAMAAQATGSIEFDAVRLAVAKSEARDWIIGLTLLGFGIKAGVIGLHVWLPLAHPVAPTPASAVLSGAMIAAGLLGWLRVLPLGEVTLTGWGEMLVIAGLASVYYAVLVGLVQKKAKVVLAYSSISKMGIMTMGVGLGLLAPQSWPLLLTAILVFAVHHGLAKGALFLGVGMIASPPASKVQRYLLIAGLLLPALSLAGAPLTSGMIAKQLFKLPMISITSPLLDWIHILLAMSAVATTLLMARFLYLVWPQCELSLENVNKSAGQPASMWWSWLFLLAVVTMFPFYIVVFYQTSYWPMSMLFSALWPVVVGGVIAALFCMIHSRRQIQLIYSVPPGDLIVIIEKWIYPLLKSVLLFTFLTVSKRFISARDICSDYSNNKYFARFLDLCEKQLGRWTVALTLLLLTGGLLLLLLF